MAKWDAGVADFSISGKGVKDTYDDGDEREVIIDELNNVLLPQYTAYPNPQLHPMDVRVVDENGIIQYWAEIECGKEEHIDYRKHAGSILGRKRKSVLEHYKIAPVLMFFLNNSKTRYFLYYFNYLPRPWFQYCYFRFLNSNQRRYQVYFLCRNIYCRVFGIF